MKPEILSATPNKASVSPLVAILLLGALIGANSGEVGIITASLLIALLWPYLVFSWSSREIRRIDASRFDTLRSVPRRLAALLRRPAYNLR